MVDIRHYTFYAISAILLTTTAYSVLYDTYLDTSDPLVAHLPHKLASSHYFASKRTPLNVYFIKRAWGWTSGLFLLSYATAPVPARTKDRLFKFLFLTAVWLLFTRWFFGPGLFERLIVLSGGECALRLPGGDALSVPHALCHRRVALAPSTHPNVFPLGFSVADVDPAWSGGVPRLSRGHDVSGHVFLLTAAALFLADQLRPSFRHARWGALHAWALAGNVALLAVWLFALGTTGVYFHSPFEKLTGFVLGAAAFALTQAIFGSEVQTHPRAARARE